MDRFLIIGGKVVTGFDHIAIIVRSEDTVEFYVKLGFQEVFRKIRDYDTIVLLEGFGMKILFFIDPNHPDRPVKPEMLGLRLLALKVDKIETTVEMLGLIADSVSYDWFGTRYAYVKDPDGNIVELHE